MVPENAGKDVDGLWGSSGLEMKGFPNGFDQLNATQILLEPHSG
jgi:hypothetical protein